jgi:hypothetical protein
VDEALRGYMTKYDCSSADVNPIGGVAKADLKRFLAYARDKFGLGALGGILEASVVDPDPQGSETFSRIRIRNSRLWIRIRIRNWT